MLGTKWWGAFLWFAILLNVASFIVNLLMGHWVILALPVFALIWLAWVYKAHRLEREVLQRARVQMEATDAP